MVDGHAVTQDSADELGIVPVLGIEALAQTFDCRLVAALIDELEVIVLLAVAVVLRFGDHERTPGDAGHPADELSGDPGVAAARKALAMRGPDPAGRACRRRYGSV